ncbi:MAG: hypothetical protein JWR52_1382 [Marmoricola sp.]|nr:hypothetical protein [Marmoricola sp.]
MAKKVILHVGAPKTGTSFVQDLLFSERLALAARGILYPADRFDAHFLAALDLMQLPWGGIEREATGAWDRLAEKARAWPGTVVISHEILATASRVQVARALESLGGEVHIVYSARDLVRQLPAEWQENVKHRREATYASFLDDLQDPERASELARWFWGVQEVPDVLDRWGSTLPKENIHLITVPPPGAPRDLLWHRFAQVLDLDPEEYAREEGRTNASLGVAEVAVLRQLNEKICDFVPNYHYRALVRESLVHQNLSQNRGSAALSVPPDVWTWADQISRSWVAELALRGYDVVGDLDDLLPRPPSEFVDPDNPPAEDLARAGLRALTAMTIEAARLRDETVELHEEIDRLHGEIRSAHATRFYVAKQHLVAKARTSPVAARGLAAYRRWRA